MQKGQSLILILVGVLIVVGIAGGAYYLGKQRSSSAPSNNQTACTQDAKICPDGSAVGRVGPNCEFAECPKPSATPDETANWKTYINTKYSFSFKYPPDWILNEEGSEDGYAVWFYRPDYKDNPIQIQLNIQKNGTLEKEISTLKKQGIEMKNTTINNTPAIVFTGQIGNGIGYIKEFSRDNNLYSFDVRVINQNLNDYIELLDKIINTFKFQ